MAGPTRLLPQSINDTSPPLTRTLLGWTSPCSSVGVSRARTDPTRTSSAAAVTSWTARSRVAAGCGSPRASATCGSTQDRHRCRHQPASTRGISASSLTAAWYRACSRASESNSAAGTGDGRSRNDCPARCSLTSHGPTGSEPQAISSGIAAAAGRTACASLRPAISCGRACLPTTRTLRTAPSSSSRYSVIRSTRSETVPPAIGSAVQRTTLAVPVLALAHASSCAGSSATGNITPPNSCRDSVRRPAGLRTRSQLAYAVVPMQSWRGEGVDGLTGTRALMCHAKHGVLLRGGGGVAPDRAHLAAQQQAAQRAAQQRVQQRRQAQLVRIWQRTAAKRAARQVETELAIQEREDQQRRYADAGERIEAYRSRRHTEAREASAELAKRTAALDSLLETALSTPLDVGFPALKRRSAPGRRWLPGQRSARERARAQAEAIGRLEAGYRARSREAVEEYAGIVLAARSWPEGLQPSWRLRYRPGSRQLDAEYELPGPQLVPVARACRYLPERDELVWDPAPETEVRHRYAGVVAQVVLCVLADLYRALEPTVVDVIRLNGRVSVVDERSSRRDRPHLVSLAVTRQRWTSLRLGSADPYAHLHALDALVSPNPYALVPVRPWAVFEPRSA